MEKHTEDLFKTGLSETRKTLLHIRKSLEQANNAMGQVVSNKGLEVVNQMANSMVFPQEDESGMAAYDNLAIVESTGSTTKVIITNVNPKAVFIEFGTGRVGEATSHPKSAVMGWEYYVPSEFKREKDGLEGWYYDGIFRYGITSSPFYYESGKEIRRSIGEWYAREFEKALKEGK